MTAAPLQTGDKTGILPILDDSAWGAPPYVEPAHIHTYCYCEPDRRDRRSNKRTGIYSTDVFLFLFIYFSGHTHFALRGWIEARPRQRRSGHRPRRDWACPRRGACGARDGGSGRERYEGVLHGLQRIWRRKSVGIEAEENLTLQISHGADDATQIPHVSPRRPACNRNYLRPRVGWPELSCYLMYPRKAAWPCIAAGCACMRDGSYNQQSSSQFHPTYIRPAPSTDADLRLLPKLPAGEGTCPWGCQPKAVCSEIPIKHDASMPAVVVLVAARDGAEARAAHMHRRPRCRSFRATAISK